MYVTEMRNKWNSAYVVARCFGVVDEGNAEEFVCCIDIDTALSVLNQLQTGIGIWNHYGRFSHNDWEPLTVSLEALSLQGRLLNSEESAKLNSNSVLEVDKSEVPADEGNAAAVPFACKARVIWRGFRGWAVVIGIRGEFIWCGKDEKLADSVLVRVLQKNSTDAYHPNDVSELEGSVEMDPRKCLADRKAALLEQLSRIAEELSDIFQAETNL